jgi:hypothetical protein
MLYSFLKFENVMEHNCEQHLDWNCICKICLNLCHEVENTTYSPTGTMVDTCKKCGKQERWYDSSGTTINTTLYFEWEPRVGKFENEIDEQRAFETFQDDSFLYTDTIFAYATLKSRFDTVRKSAINKMNTSQVCFKALEYVIENDDDEHFRNLADEKRLVLLRENEKQILEKLRKTYTSIAVDKFIEEVNDFTDIQELMEFARTYEENSSRRLAISCITDEEVLFKIASDNRYSGVIRLFAASQVKDISKRIDFDIIHEIATESINAEEFNFMYPDAIKCLNKKGDEKLLIKEIINDSHTALNQFIKLSSQLPSDYVNKLYGEVVASKAKTEMRKLAIESITDCNELLKITKGNPDIYKTEESVWVGNDFDRCCSMYESRITDFCEIARERIKHLNKKK